MSFWREMRVWAAWLSSTSQSATTLATFETARALLVPMPLAQPTTATFTVSLGAW